MLWQPVLTVLTLLTALTMVARFSTPAIILVRENGRYWITTPNGPIWSNIDERGVNPALNYLFEKREQEQQSSQ